MTFVREPGKGPADDPEREARTAELLRKDKVDVLWRKMVWVQVLHNSGQYIVAFMCKQASGRSLAGNE